MTTKHDITDQLSNEADKIYICPLFDSHNQVKLDGATWCYNKRSWYILDKNNELYSLYKKQYLFNNYDLISLYKQHNARWDPRRKAFYTYNSNKFLQEYFVENPV